MNVLVTNFDGTDENVMIFTELHPKQFERFFTIVGKSFGEICEVPDVDCQYYIYDPVWVSEAQHKNILKTLKANKC